MGARLRAVFSSLGVRLLIPLLLVVGVVLTVYALFSFRTTKDHFLHLVGGEADRSTGLILRATYDGMLLNRLDEVQVMIERLAEGPDVAAIRVYDKDGAVVLSSDRGQLGERSALADPPCASCHAGDAEMGAGLRATDLVRGEDGEVLRQLSVIEKEPACTAGGCHANAADQSVLGILDVEMSMVPLEVALASERRQIIRTTLGLMAVIGLVATVIFRRLVQQPIRRLKDGTRRIAGGDLSTRIHVEGGHELAYLARDFNHMAEDLSRSQQEVTEWSQKLEAKVVEKTAELRAAQRQVLHMEKMASLGKLSATVAHEINNPLSGVLTYARLVERELAEQELPDDVRAALSRYLRLAQQECSRCGDIVQNLLVFARRTGTDMTAVDVNEILDRSLMLVRHHLEITGITLRTEPLEGDPTLRADPGQLQQALVALLVNAVEAMPRGGELTVRVSGDADRVRIRIGDTGVGIAPEVQPLIFEPFFSTKDQESGVGLGLAVVYGIVSRHGGTIDVESQVGTGTTFHLDIPREPPPESADSRAVAGRGAGAGVAPDAARPGVGTFPAAVGGGGGP
ncbi:MAG TPA: ATP-binding protein [Longimicrobiales bacterium]|nr:ATP-binding protein [Longimicrobiales bacterium]